MSGRTPTPPRPVNVSTELLRSFVAIVEQGSMKRAAERVYLTQSAISQQMQRLEKCLHRDLFRRVGHNLALNLAGEQLLGVARQILELNDRLVDNFVYGSGVDPTIRIGLGQGLSDAVLSDELGRFARDRRSRQLQVSVQDTADLLRALQGGELDLAMTIEPEGNSAAVKTVPMVWMGKQHLTEEAVLPVALLQRPCIFRDAAASTLEAAGRSYRVVLETPHLADLRAAVQGGFGITCHTGMMIDDDLIEALPTQILPPLPRVSYTLRTARDACPEVALLAARLKQVCQALA